MAKSIKANLKRRGRPATGKDPMIGARFAPSIVAEIDAWAEKAGEGCTRSEAIRRLVELGLKLQRAPK